MSEILLAITIMQAWRTRASVDAVVQMPTVAAYRLQVFPNYRGSQPQPWQELVLWGLGLLTSSIKVSSEVMVRLGVRLPTAQ